MCNIFEQLHRVCQKALSVSLAADSSPNGGAKKEQREIAAPLLPLPRERWHGVSRDGESNKAAQSLA